MSKLNTFVFSIHSNLCLDDLDYLPSNVDIRRTFKGLEDYQIISYIDYFPNDKIGQRHIYSHSYRMSCLYRLTNNFPDNQSPQNHKQSQQSNVNNSSFSVIEYPHFTILGFASIHDDYIEQLRFHTKPCLSNYITLHSNYHRLQSTAKWDVPKHFHTFLPLKLM
ncbi:unnamed protein product [Rotaria socialis]|uniref:Uncharacterized protein n=1 Tax=Rotaria socialis TaxID=392032 RepID=A0A820N192_9BILA|nr:unnamed protein product [Rotaria socialis]CAF4417662.1 unnamed protein product [Rotaria socialis]CAF4569250.1 unnamed protein product [Rotaria socialis]